MFISIKDRRRKDKKERKRRKKKKKKRERERKKDCIFRKKSLQAQVDPLFIFFFTSSAHHIVSCRTASSPSAAPVLGYCKSLITL